MVRRLRRFRRWRLCPIIRMTAPCVSLMIRWLSNSELWQDPAEAGPAVVLLRICNIFTNTTALGLPRNRNVL